MNPSKTRLEWLEACAPLTEPEHAYWNHYSYSQSPVVKVTPYGHLGGDSTWTPTYIAELWTSEVHQDSHTGSATSSCTLDSLLSAITLSTLVNLWFCFTQLQKESLRPDPPSSPWNQDQQHKDDFPGSWVTQSFTLHTHTPSPISSLLVS